MVRENAANTSSPSTVESTSRLLQQIREGSEDARERLLARYLPILTCWASSRIPPWARAAAETGDLVQDTLVRALEKLEDFEYRREGAFLAYLRQILMRRLYDHIDRVKTRLNAADHDLPAPTAEPSPLQHAMGARMLEAYETALLELTESHREAIIMHVELGYDYDRIAEALGSTTPNAARGVVRRALERLAELMEVHRGE